ncbi:MAG: EF-hand domain-containing protein, partial [Moorea sp. SIO1F2]|nr:EF-hand domain-containing protein [Moorena sp. SIO1F2]
MNKKHTKNFWVYDADKNGYVEKADLEQCARNLALLRGWKAGMPEFEDISAKYAAIWQKLFQPADINGDGKVELEEYLKVADKSIANFPNSAELQEAHSAKANIIFSILDSNGNGTISLAEYKQFCKAVQLDEDI